VTALYSFIKRARAWKFVENSIEFILSPRLRSVSPLIQFLVNLSQRESKVIKETIRLRSFYDPFRKTAYLHYSFQNASKLLRNVSKIEDVEKSTRRQ